MKSRDTGPRLRSPSSSRSRDALPTRRWTSVRRARSIPPPEDQLSRDILRDFNGRDFELGQNDREAVVRLTDWPEGKHIIIPFWLGINPLMPYFHRPQVGRIYVMSESVMVRELTKDRYLIRAGSKAFKNDAIFEATHTRYDGEGKMLPTVVRFVGTVVETLPLDPPRTGTITEKVPVLREVSLPMHLDATRPRYAKFIGNEMKGADAESPCE